jgi:hypothetical protein
MKIKRLRNYFWVPGGGIVAPSIQFTASSLLDSASVGDDVGTATVPGTTGTASWSLTDDASGKYSINSSTGLVEVANTLTAGSDTITIAVSGVTPSVANRSFSISVTAAASGAAGSPIGLLLILTKAA